MMYHAQEKIVNVPGSNTTGKRGGILNSVTRVVVKPTHMVGGYAQLSYGFNYYGTVGSQRDEYVVLHKIEDSAIDWLERPLTRERELQLNPPGITPTPTLPLSKGETPTPSLPLSKGEDKGGDRKASLIEKEVA
jgi:nitrate reductase alpha subunit